MNFCINCRKLGTTYIRMAAQPKPLSSKWKYKLDDNVEKNLEDVVFKPRHHPGIVKPSTVILPQQFTKAILNILEDQNNKAQIMEESKEFVRHLVNKKAPMEQDELKNVVDVLQQRVIRRLSKNRSDLVGNEHVIKNQMNDRLKKAVYNWNPIKYDIRNCLLYLVGKSPADYAVLVKIFSEIKSRDSEWKPRSLIDFGSGVGTVTWAANTVWTKSILEYFNVDAASEMNDLAELLMKEGRGEKQMSMQGIFYRQFLPATATPYDLVVSAYSLMELPSLKNRLEVVRNLWKKTTKYLVVVEQGTNSGYKIINEVRDYILGHENGHVFSPVSPNFDSFK
ncbi:hypothetical protein HHI36_020664 [Cryptolaemus montrouzieri]|uniref:Methyltransferase-like protein 17, mitochondrial n=1 Tax=Cryptolaemus montrouzieri TaxID=559131 RepID=A0ABD2NC15_9CUCU